MKALILATTMLVALMGKTDDVYNRFLNLKQEGVDERDRFYQGVTNGMVGMDGQWMENGGGMIFTTPGNGITITNVEYYVRVYTVSNNLASTNLTCVNQSLRNGEVQRYTFDKSGRMSRIEHELSRRGDFKCYEVDTNEDLTCYYSLTNCVGEHGLMMYKNGQLMEVGGVPDFSIFRP